MIAKVYTSIPHGFDGKIIEVECAITQGLPQFDIVGMATKTIFESRQRVRNAIKASGLKWPASRITINLAPANLIKSGNFFDVPIAIAILIASGQLLESDTFNSIFCGELSLEGHIRSVPGIINIIETGKTFGYKKFFIPINNVPQANLIDKTSIVGVSSLKELLKILNGQTHPNTQTTVVKNNKTDISSVFLDNISGQTLAKKALITAVAGRHNIILSGPPGSGKTMLAKSAISLMPDLSKEEIITATKIHGLVNQSKEVITSRPFRSPHHTSTTISLIGGGSNRAIPGEISLAHLGVLFLDELPEYPRSTLESLRQPLEDKRITITRSNISYTFPANFMLIATMNPCPCGYLGDKEHQCNCKNFEIQRYKNKLSGPLLDRIDIRINVNRVKNSELCLKKLSANEYHNVVKNNITEAINRQHARYGDSTTLNADLSSTEIVKFIKLDTKAKNTLDNASETLRLSARSYFKTIKVAQTIADLEASNIVKASHIIEALSYRMEL